MDDPEQTRTDSSADQPAPSRRRLLQATATAGALAGFGVSAAAQDDQERIELGGNTPGWEGRVPDEIEGDTNPTLDLEEGTTYVVEWENVDGEPHNFVIEDADGNNLVESEVISERGATQTVEFEAARAMAEYYCEVHPVSMRGEISIGDADGEEDPDPAGEESFFQEGASVGVQTVAEGLTAPTDFAVPGGDDDRMFVTDQTGELRVVTGDGVREEPFLDVSERMVAISEEFAGSYADPESDYDERGLLGVDLHPNFADNGRLFVHYSAPPNQQTPDGWSHVEVVSEFRVPEGGQSANPESEQKILQFQKPQYNHDSGPMAFGPDGYLYVPMGDGGGANDEMYGHGPDWYGRNAGGNGQNVSRNLLGGVHRIDVDAGGEGSYGVPDDNPLVGRAGRDEYYAWGFRNPFGISFDSDGRLFVADAGQALFEEANVVEMGGNYGWNVKEGTHCFSTDNPGDPPENCPDSTPDDVRDGEELIDPIVEYPHTYQGQSEGIVIAGGHVYEGETVSALQGKYIFGDWTQDVARDAPMGRVFAATEPDGGNGGDDGNQDDSPVPLDDLWNMEELVFEGGQDGNLNRFVRQFGQDGDGEVYVLVNARGVPEGDTGEVLKLVPPGEGEEIESPEGPDGDDGDGGGGDGGGDDGGGKNGGENDGEDDGGGGGGNDG